MNAIKALIFKPEIQVLDLDTFKNSHTIALVNVPEICAKSGKKVQKTLAKNLKNLSEKSTKKAQKSSEKLAKKIQKENANFAQNKEKLAEFLLFCKCNNISFTNPEFLGVLNEQSLQKIMLELALKLGVTFLNLDKDYGIKEFMRTALQYLKDYGGYDIPEHFYDKISKLPKTDTPSQIYSFNTQIFSTSLDTILISKKNPNTQDLMILDNLKYASKLECSVVSNRVVLAKILSINTLNFSFTPHNVASIRIFAQIVKEKQKHLKTSQKRFILHSLQGFDEALVMDDFATHKAFWKGVEKQIKPTQKKYEKFAKAREFFRKLKNNDFAKSNNAIIEKSLKNDDIISKMAALKSPQYALRNITKVLKNNPNLDFTPQLKKLKPTLKQLVELYLHLQSPSGISKIKTKFFKHDTQPLSVEKREAAAVIIKNLIAQKCKKMAQIYAKTRENLTPLKACKRPLDELKSVALPVQNDCFFDAPLNAGYVSRGSKIPFAQLGIAEDFCAFVAWKRKDGAAGNLDLDLSACYIGEMGVSHINYTRLNDEKTA